MDSNGQLDSMNTEQLDDDSAHPDLFLDLLFLHLITLVLFSTLVCHFLLSTRHMLELKLDIYHKAADACPHTEQASLVDVSIALVRDSLRYYTCSIS